MVKQTKRTRKFNASGGVKARLEKGSTIRTKGKILKKRKRQNDDEKEKQVATQRNNRPKLDETQDFSSEKNVGGLDLDSFFEKVSASLEQGDFDDEGSLPDSSPEDNGESDEEESSSDSSSAEQSGQKQQISSKDDGSSDNSSTEDSDDEDAEVSEARLKKEMAKMKEQDPDFYNYLKENEQSLLEFGEESESDSEDDEDEDINEGTTSQEEAKTSATKKPVENILLTAAVLKSLEQGVFKSHGIKAIKKLVGAYRTACHMADSSEESKRPRPGESGVQYVIDSPRIFDSLMVMCLDRLAGEFRFQLFGKDSSDDPEDSDDTPQNDKPINPKKIEKAANWSEMKTILQSFFRSTLHLMDQSKEAELLTFVLKALAKYIPLLSTFPRLAEAMLKTLTALWSAPLDSTEDYQVVRLNSFLRIRQLALTQPFPFIENVLKKTYLAYSRRARFSGTGLTTSLPTLTFMGNCLVELYSLDYHSSYQHAFVYIRQLALYLRAALQKKTEESFQQVYCWQYINCLKLWTAVLANAASQPDGDSMRSLIYPLVEIINGACRHMPAPVRHMPYRLHCVRFLQQLAAASGTFIPTSWILLECLACKEWKQKPMKTKSSTTTRGIQMNIMLKFPKDDILRTHDQLEAAMNELVVLLEREVDLYRYSPGFPEFSIRIRECLKRFASETRNSRWRAFMRGAMETINEHSRFAMQARSKLEEAPKDIKQLECLLPPSMDNMRLRYEASVAKEAKSMEATKQTEVVDETPVISEKKSKEMKAKVAKKKKQKSAPQDSGVLSTEDEVVEGVDWVDDD